MSAGVYIHVPFCRSRCSYCDFATDIYREAAWVERYIDAVCREIDLFHCLPPVPHVPARRDGTASRVEVDTIYFGGGTPSLLAREQVERLLKAIELKFQISDLPEVTMEMNPGTVAPDSLAAYRSLGVNRASFGVQTFDDRALKLLARGHDADDARRTFAMLRDAGFDNISFDLIAGLPGQTLGDWSRNLDEAIGMQPEHLSLYLLEIHEGTPLAEQVRSKRQPTPDDETAGSMYEMMLDRLAAAGYAQYEISNFCTPGFESRHNSKYWTLDPVFAFGVSAHSFDGRQRYANKRDTAKYVDMIESFGSAEVMREDTNLASEFIFLGLRMEKGIDLVEYRRRFGGDLLSEFNGQLERLSEHGLIDVTTKHMRLTRKGKLFSNDVFAVFV